MHILGLLIIFCILCVRNFPLNTWYTGWDNLHPEFNFWLNFSRALSSVWQDNQGLGTYGGHGYAATLPHTIFLFLMSIFLPSMYLRSTFTFLMLLMGSLGVFALIRKLLSHAPEQYKNHGAIAGGLFYMLNFGTVQNFYIQLEAFIIHFAFFPWLLYSLLNFLTHKSKKNLIVFALISFLASSQGFIPPLFFVYMMFLCIFLGVYFIYKPSIKKVIEALGIVILTLMINAYWFLPVVNYTLTRTNVYLNAYNNLSSTEDFILKNKKYGNVKDVALLKGFIYETIDQEEDGRITSIFRSWYTHMEKKSVSTLGYTLFGIVILGGIYMVKKRQDFAMSAFAASLVIAFSSLTTNTFPFSLFSRLLQELPIARQAFRVAFTKFSVSLSFFYAVAFGLGVCAILLLLSRKGFGKKMGVLTVGIVLIGVLYFSKPSFEGNFLYQRTKVAIPTSYFELFDFFKTQDSHGKIANLPQGWNWGWSVYRWGYSGSGFLWYGIEQPILDRSFDAWSNYNENYFWELSYALYSEKYNLIDSIFEKYHVQWVVFDQNIVPYASVKGFLYSDRLETYLNTSAKLRLVKTITSPTAQPIKVYEVLYKPLDNSLGELDMSATHVEPSFSWNDVDTAYEKNGDYYSSSNSPIDIYYPFRTLFSSRSADESVFNVQENFDSFTFTSSLPSTKTGNYQLYIPPLSQDESYFDQDTQSLISDEVPHVYLDENITYPLSPDSLSSYQFTLLDPVPSHEIKVVMPKNQLTLIYDSTKDSNFSSHEAVNCNPLLQYLSSDTTELTQHITGDKSLRFFSKNTENCYDISLDSLSQRYAYLVTIQSAHIEGKSLQFAIIDHQTKKPQVIQLPTSGDMETSHIVIPPFKWDGLGYSLHFNNISIGNNPTTNDLKKIQVYRFPYSFLKEIQMTQAGPLQKKEDRVITNYQSYDVGWKAYEVERQTSNVKRFLSQTLPFLFGKEIKEHVMVNNWANGFPLRSDMNRTSEGQGQIDIVIIFWPQYLEYIGFALLLGTIFYITRYKGSNKVK